MDRAACSRLSSHSIGASTISVLLQNILGRAMQSCNPLPALRSPASVSTVTYPILKRLPTFPHHSKCLLSRNYTSSPAGRTLSLSTSPSASSRWTCLPRQVLRTASSSTRWTERHKGDQFARAAKVQGLKSRAAFKLLQINERYRLFRPGMTIVDLGFAPGSWSQV